MNTPKAFPLYAIESTDEGVNVHFDSGMTLLDYFAGQAIATVADYSFPAQMAAKKAYEIAIAMLLERESIMNPNNPNS